MTKIDINNTELVWPGKYNENGTLKEVPRVNMPFQVIETVNKSRITREAEKSKQLTLFDIWKGDEGQTFESGWMNKLIWGDNLLVMNSLIESYAGKIDLIYIDPPFATGTDFSFISPIGDGDIEVAKEQSLLEEKAYRDTWGSGIESYLHMMYVRLNLMKDLLSETGSIYVHCDWHVGHLIKMILLEIFGHDSLKSEIVWPRTTNTGSSKSLARRFSFDTDTLLLFSKTSKYIFNQQFRPYSPEYIKHYFVHDDNDGRGSYQLQALATYSEETFQKLKEDGRLVYGKGKNPRYKDYLKNKKGVVINNLWDDIEPVNAVAYEKTGFVTQKPEALLERVIKASSNEGQLIVDLFCGSGTTLAVAEKLGRRWIGCDLGRYAIHTTRKRLLEIKGCKPFEILNLGKYERQYWQISITDSKVLTEHSLYEYLAFILRLYGAQPVVGLTYLHGKKGRAMVHIGSVDAPVTIDELSSAIDECVKLRQPELHVLGWEWEMGLAGPNNDYKKGSLMHEVSKQKGVKLFLLQIPRDVMEQQAVDQGDIQFFELAYLNVEIEKPKKLTVIVSIKDFVIPNTELIPEEVREKISKWSDYVDYWALDWDFRNDTFMQGWVAYRTRQDRSLSLKSDRHTYERPGRYRILVKVVDIFGNDTSQAYDVQVV